MNLTGVNMFKRHIYEFSKKSQNWRFLKMHKNLPVEKIRMFDVFPSRNDPFDDTSSKFQ